MLQNISLDTATLSCCDVMCTDQSHTSYINCVMILWCAVYGLVRSVFFIVKHISCPVPYWKEMVKHLRESSLLWHHIWVQYGKPK